MTIQERVNSNVVEALSPIAPVQPDEYIGESDVYIEFDYSETGMSYFDNKPKYILIDLTVRFFAPSGKNVTKERTAIASAILGAGWLRPTVENASDQTGQAYVYTTQKVWRNG